MIKAEGTAAAPSTTTSLPKPLRRFVPASRNASIGITENFANSEGWKPNSHRCAPIRAVPIPGIITSTSATSIAR